MRGTVARYRKRPVVIEAIQLRWDTWSEVAKFVGVGRLSDGKPEGCYVSKDGRHRTDDSNGRIGLVIPTLEGVMLAVQDDWIIRGLHGEFYPCKPDVFEASYEAVDP